MLYVCLCLPGSRLNGNTVDPGLSELTVVLGFKISSCNRTLSPISKTKIIILISIWSDWVNKSWIITYTAEFEKWWFVLALWIVVMSGMLFSWLNTENAALSIGSFCLHAPGTMAERHLKWFCVHTTSPASTSFILLIKYLVTFINNNIYQGWV